MAFEGVDYFNIDELLPEDALLLRQTVRNFVEAEIKPIIEEHYMAGTFPMDLVPKLSALGLLGIKAPAEYGGSNASYLLYGIAMQELERGDSGIRSFCSVQNSLVIYPILTYGTEEQKKKWIPLLASGKAIGCFGLTEPDYGSNPGGMKTTAQKVDGGFILNGTKMWITNGSIADVAVVWAKYQDVVHGFLVEKGTPGFTTQEMHGKHSLRASITSELIFQDCFVPEENVLQVEGLKGPLSCLTQARYGIAWGAVGAAMECYDVALKYAKTRIQFDRPIASFQLVQNKLVWMLTEITKAQLVNFRLAQLMDSGKARFQHVSFAKRNNVAIALDCARIARDILGANGIINEYPIMRHMANLETVKTYEGTHDIHTLILGEDITGIQAFHC